jgi:3-methyladenine DNA glycosylase AlkC
MSEQRLMKDGLGGEAISRIAESLSLTIPQFPKTLFIDEAIGHIENLELKERVHHLIAVLNNHLPTDFNETAEILLRLKSNWIAGNPSDNLNGFAAWPIIDYIGEYGLEHPEVSLNALRELTSMFSAEFAIRPFIIEHQKLTFQFLKQWCADPDEHVRRLVSEGTRPRLPWGQQLPKFIEDPSPLFPLLETLKDDPSDYVRRSVANNLNDISKDHPEKVIALFKRWKRGGEKNREWIIRHATRTLIKAGHPDVFGLLGYTENPKLTLQQLKIAPPEIYLGESITFAFQLCSTNPKPQTVVIDYAIHHMKANGKANPKVFKFRTLKMAPGETVELVKKHAIKPITTRKYYSGEHAIEVLINGKRFGIVPFVLHLK